MSRHRVLAGSCAGVGNVSAGHCIRILDSGNPAVPLKPRIGPSERGSSCFMCAWRPLSRAPESSFRVSHFRLFSPGVGIVPLPKSPELTPPNHWVAVCGPFFALVIFGQPPLLVSCSLVQCKGRGRGAKGLLLRMSLGGRDSLGHERSLE